MKKNPNKKKVTRIRETALRIRETALRRAIAELSEISEKREKELREMDRVAKMLMRRDLRLTETVTQLEKQRNELDHITKLLVRRDLELNKEKDKTLAIITNFSDGLLVFDKESKLLLINPRAEDFLGVKGEKIIGRPTLELSRIAALKPLVKLFGKKIKEVFRKELKISEDLVLEVSIVPVIEEKERLETLVILHDVTREKLIERMKTEFVSLAAHQLRTPLSAIKWTTRMVLDEELGKINKEQREFLEDSYNSNERMITLINDLLNVARIEEGRYLYKMTLANIGELAKSVVDSYKKEAKRRGLKVEFKKPKKELAAVMIDVEKMQIAIDNLVRNAIRYTLRNGKVIVSLKCGKKEIEFSVKDSGVGIPRQQQKRVFTKFFRGVNVIRMETEGTGLGLYITKNIIEAHRGKIWFESGPGKGTTFYFTLPIRKKATSS